MHLDHIVATGTGLVLVKHGTEVVTNGDLMWLKNLWSSYGRPKLMVINKRTNFGTSHESRSQSLLLCNALAFMMTSSSDPPTKSHGSRSFYNALQWWLLELFKPKFSKRKDFNQRANLLPKVSHDQFKHYPRTCPSSFIFINKHPTHGKVNS